MSARLVVQVELNIFTNFIPYFFTATDMKFYHASTRMVALTILTFSYILYNYYSASIVSNRLSEIIPKINDSLNELSKLSIPMSSEPMKYFEFYIAVRMNVLFINLIHFS